MRAASAVLFLVCSTLLPACGGMPPQPATPLALPTAAPPDPAPPAVASYESTPSSNALEGGDTARATEQALREALQPRGVAPDADGRLGAVAAFVAHRQARGLDTSAAQVELVARRAGFVGPTPWILILRERRGDSVLGAEVQRAFASTATNIPITRYGVAAIERGYGWLIVAALGSVELSIDPIPRHVDPHDKVAIRASVADRFTHAALAVTLPTGEVRTRTFDGRKMSAPLGFDRPGVHKVEIVGDGASGPVVLANFPLYVGVDEPAPSTLDAPAGVALGASATTPSEVEARMLELLNDARAEAHLKPLAADPALAVLGRADAQDMVDHRFFSHVSPTNGTVEDRLRRAGQLYPLFGENISRAGSPEEGHRGLMDSPGHRANILNDAFTHVGIGAVVEERANGGGQTVVFEFARERPIALAQVPAQVTSQLNATREEAGLARLTVDQGLARAAQAAAEVLATDPTANNPETAHRGTDAARKALAGGKTASCIYVWHAGDVRATAGPALVRRPDVTRLGIAAAPLSSGPESFQLVVILAGRGRALSCQ